MKRFIKRFLGINELENRIDYLERNSKYLDKQVETLRSVFPDWELIVALASQIKELEHDDYLAKTPWMPFRKKFKLMSPAEIVVNRETIDSLKQRLKKVITQSIKSFSNNRDGYKSTRVIVDDPKINTKEEFKEEQNQDSEYIGGKL